MRHFINSDRRLRVLSFFLPVWVAVFLGGTIFVSNAYSYVVDLYSCSMNVTLVELHSKTGYYVFDGQCKENDHQKNVTVKIVGSSRKVGGHYSYLTDETIYIKGFGDKLDTISFFWQCIGEPWLEPGNCERNVQSLPQKSSTSIGTVPTYRYLLGPYSQRYSSKVKKYIDANTPPPAPTVETPYNLKYLDPDGFHIKIGYKRYGLYRVYKYPEQAKNIVLHWEYWEPAPDGKGGSYVWKKDVMNNATLITGDTTDFIIPAEKLREGKWRLSVKHAISNWPWKKVEFWIGPPVDYTKSKPVIVSPSQNAILNPVKEGMDSFEIDILVNSGYNNKKGYSASKVQPTNVVTINTARKIEVQYEKLFNGKWGPSSPVFLKTEPGKTLTVYDSKGRYRIRARWYVENPGSANPAYPWTEWRNFRAGKIEIANIKDKIGQKIIDLSKVGKLDTGGMKAMSGETKTVPGGEKKQVVSRQKGPQPTLKKFTPMKITCLGKPATIVGTQRGEKLEGTPGDDVIAGLDGDDTIYGKGGNDIICGGNGNDKLYGGNGKDILWGDNGDDKLWGQSGNDNLIGGMGNDSLYGGDGDDKLDGKWGNDIVSGDNGNDHVWGSEGNDRLYGGYGNDEMRGGPGNDIMKGGHGNDEMNGYDGNDTLYGEAGDDILRGGSGSDLCEGGSGNNTVYPDCEPVHKSPVHIKPQRKQMNKSKGKSEIRQIQPVKPSEGTPLKDKGLPRLKLNTR